MDEAATVSAFKPGWRFYAAFSSLCVVMLAAALDATSLSVALPVRCEQHDDICDHKVEIDSFADHFSTP